MNSEDIPMRMSPELDNAIPPSRVGWMESAGDPRGETCPQGATLAYDQMADGNGGFGTGVAIRGADGELMAGCLLHPLECIPAAKYLFECGLNGLEVMALAAEPEQRAILRQTIKDELTIAMLSVFADAANEFKRQTYNDLKAQLELANSAWRKEMRADLEEDLRKELDAEYRERVLSLARASSAEDPTVRAEALRPLMPWIKSLIESAG